MKRISMFFVIAVFGFSFAGCATAPKKNSELEGLKNQVTTLEEELKSKDAEIANLKDELARSPQVKECVELLVAKQSPKGIQSALKNAGFYNGPIDGKLGKQTRDAIKAFQKANNLTVDGKVGHNTWNLLKLYLQKKVK